MYFRNPPIDEFENIFSKIPLIKYGTFGDASPNSGDRTRILPKTLKKS